jgi:hypothetical protein
MVTITAPSSNPTPTYNRSGVTIDTIAYNDSSAASTPIVRATGTTVVLVTGDLAGGFVTLPANAEVGDTVEIYPAEGAEIGACTVLTPSSTVLINSYFTSGGVGMYRLLSEGNWGAIWSKTE